MRGRRGKMDEGAGEGGKGRQGGETYPLSTPSFVVGPYQEEYVLQP